MTNDFTILSRFLARFEPEVDGHAAPGVNSDLDAAITALAKGELDPARRAEVVRKILSSDIAIELLAERARALA